MISNLISIIFESIYCQLLLIFFYSNSIHLCLILLILILILMVVHGILCCILIGLRLELGFISTFSNRLLFCLLNLSGLSRISLLALCCRLLLIFISIFAAHVLFSINLRQIYALFSIH